MVQGRSEAHLGAGFFRYFRFRRHLRIEEIENLEPHRKKMFPWIGLTYMGYFVSHKIMQL